MLNTFNLTFNSQDRMYKIVQEISGINKYSA